MKSLYWSAWTVFVVACLFGIFHFMVGSGGLKRMTTLSGIYSVCKPDGYDVVCFLDSSGKDGGASCVPLSLAGGKCVK